MINAQEIRMGNYFKDHTGRIGKVKSFFEHKVTLKMEFSTEVISTKPEFRPGLDIDPIPLTLEVLGKVGFEKYEWMDGYFIKCAGKHLMIQFYKEAVYVFFTKVSKDSHGHKMFERDYFLGAKNPDNCVYLHQLQNLFWVLTGEELTVNL